MTAVDRFPSYRAPQQDRQILCVPPWSKLPTQISAQANKRVATSVDILGRSLESLTVDARRELIEQAQRYTSAYLGTSPSVSDAGPLVLTGHQPELVHPGVWLKNFAASQLAKQLGGTAINLVIDNDLCRSPSIRVPTGTAEEPQVVEMAFDQLQSERPFEERMISERSLWDSFGDRVSKAVTLLVPNPLISAWWETAVTTADSTPKLGLALAQARHRLECDWGNETLEIPQSQVCQTASFRWFALHLLSHAKRLRMDYNVALDEYRQAHRLRSAAQPLPDLQDIDGWIETPFWVWTQEDTTRRALFAKPSAADIELSDRHSWQATLPLTADGNADVALQRLSEWEQSGVKLRTRALITTLYARLLLSDTFIHGIGGAKYDQVTDVLCELFFGVTLAPYVALSGTLRLPIDHQIVSPTRQTEIQRELRGLRFHPEKKLTGAVFEQNEQTEIQHWVAQKKHWVQTAKNEANAAERHAQIQSANQSLQAWLAPQRHELEAELSATVTQTHKNKLLESREYPFCLFPRELLQDFLLDFSRSMP